jgi:hypothetical protein
LILILILILILNIIVVIITIIWGSDAPHCTIIFNYYNLPGIIIITTTITLNVLIWGFDAPDCTKVIFLLLSGTLNPTAEQDFEFAPKELKGMCCT